jgi:hypothetical protein
VTIARPRVTAQSATVAAKSAAQLEAAEGLDLVDGIDLTTLSGGRALTRDIIALSMRAQSLIRAGLAVKALIVEGLVNSYRTLTLGARTIVLEFGVYR